MAVVKIRDLTKIYGSNTVLDHIDLDIADGMLISLLGPSGCGKTTTLRLIAGFEHADDGEIFVDNEKLNDISVHKRNIGMVFQSYALFPHMTVEKNISYGLEQRKLPKEEIKDRVAKIIQLVKLDGYEKRKPRQLSGGQQQRVALARALVVKPKILLLDECLSALDKKLRVEMQVELRRILETSKITTVFVTHDQEEAMTLSDQIVVMKDGKIEQIGAPMDVYEKPKNKFVASFLGKANFFEGTVVGLLENSLILRTENGDLTIRTKHLSSIGKSVAYAIRPERILINTTAKEENGIEGTVAYVTYSGNISTYTIDVNGFQVLVEQQNLNDGERIISGQKVYLTWDDSSCLLMEDDTDF